MNQNRPNFPVAKAVCPQAVPDEVALDHPALYFNKELGWLDFNWRVLAQALDGRLPLLERVRFVAITTSNLDEFFQKRVGGLKRQQVAGVTALSPDGRTPEEQLARIREAALVMHHKLTQTWEEDLKPALEREAGLVICDYADLTATQKSALQDYFQQEVYPVLTPLIVDPGHPFPFISNLSLSLAVVLRYPDEKTDRFARLKIPHMLPRWLPVTNDAESRQCFLPIEQLVAHHLDALFRGMEIVSVHTFRLTRNADLRRDEEEANDLLRMISDELRERRFAPVVRLEVEKAMPPAVRHLLLDELGLGPEDVYETAGQLALTDCHTLANLDLPQFKFEPWRPVIPDVLRYKADIFAAIRKNDILVHHPYHSFEATTQRLIEVAAEDPHVIAIKQTLYRTSDDSPVVKALIKAAQRGKQVAILVEIKARFDEANNIEWGRMLENVGVHVAYGIVGLKTHTKALLIVRREKSGIRTYCHIGTGNYHSKTAHLYTDFGLLTCDWMVGQDVTKLFHYLTGGAPYHEYGKVLVAPRDMRATFYDLIQQEIDYQARHGNGRIMAKMNALDDTGIIQELYRASQAGVQIDFVVRGHSRLRPQLPGYSDNIRIVSILGRFLEHDRIFYFRNNGEPRVFIGSADWRRRNLDRRVELITPVENPDLKARLIQILHAALDDNYLAWELDAEGRYCRRFPAQGEEVRNFQAMLMAQARPAGSRP